MNHHHSHQGLEQAGFFELWSPGMIWLTLVLAIAYFYFIGPYRHRFKDSTPALTRHKVLFVIGLVIFYAAAGSPLDYYSHVLFSAHMFQQSLFYYVMPPLFILGTPVYLLEALTRLTWFKRIILVRPVVSVVLFNLLFSIYHLPIVFDTIMSSGMLMSISHGILMLAAIQMWWPIISPLPEYNRLSDLRKIGYIICGAVLITPACALIIFAPSLIYETYMNAPELFRFLSGLDDQQLGGVIMKLVQELSFGTSLAYIFFRWFRRENPKNESLITPAYQPQNNKV